MSFIEICALLKSGKVIDFGSELVLPCRHVFRGRIIGIRPESGSANITHWLLNVLVESQGNTNKKKGDKIEVYWRE